jgi:hypothetical protein
MEGGVLVEYVVCWVWSRSDDIHREFPRPPDNTTYSPICPSGRKDIDVFQGVKDRIVRTRYGEPSGCCGAGRRSWTLSKE